MRITAVSLGQGFVLSHVAVSFHACQQTRAAIAGRRNWQRHLELRWAALHAVAYAWIVAVCQAASGLAHHSGVQRPKCGASTLARILSTRTLTVRRQPL
eukprot:scaffold207_cov409-Prasinococcus_capsulatus_cf.AAC.124